MAIILYYPCIIQSIIDFFFPIIVDTLSINKFKKKYRVNLTIKIVGINTIGLLLLIHQSKIINEEAV